MDPRRQAICRYRTQIWPVRYTCTSTWGGPSLVVQGGQRRRSRSRHAGDRAVLAQAPRVAATAVRVWRRGPSSLGLSGDAERPALGRRGDDGGAVLVSVSGRGRDSLLAGDPRHVPIQAPQRVAACGCRSRWHVHTYVLAVPSPVVWIAFEPQPPCTYSSKTFLQGAMLGKG